LIILIYSCRKPVSNASVVKIRTGVGPSKYKAEDRSLKTEVGNLRAAIFEKQRGQTVKTPKSRLRYRSYARQADVRSPVFAL